MTDPDLQELAELWQEPDEAEQEAFEAMARRARRQGRFLAYADLAWAVVLIGGSLFAAFMAPGPAMTAAAVVLLVTTVWLTWKRRKYRQMARTLDTTDRQAFFASSVRNARADLRRVTITMVAFPFLVPVALLLKVSFRTGADIVHPLDVLGSWVQSTRGIVTLIMLSLVMGYMYRSRLRIKAELGQLHRLLADYAEEAAPETENEE
jgi:hypothetical protein